MITFLRGQLVETQPAYVVVEVGGVGYQVFIPLSSFDKLPPVGEEVVLQTHLSIREDAHVLYGFVSAEERELFRLLIDKVSGIGPKIALAVLSGMSLTAFKKAVASGDVRSLAGISGVGKKTAERIVVELRDRLGVAATWEAATAGRGAGAGEQKVNDAVLALISLGYKQAEAHETVHGLIRHEGMGEATVETLVRAALKKLA